MSDRVVLCKGSVVSADIAVPEHEREVRFYSRVLGTGADPYWRADLMNSLGMPIIGLGERIPEYECLPMQWMPHIQVKDVAASVDRALALGGRELMSGKDDEGSMLWAGVLDPDGAAFGLIPVVGVDQFTTPEGELTREGYMGTGRIAWLDLTVVDAERARDFYSAVIGWSVSDVAMEDGDGRYADYVMSGEDGVSVSGICHARGVNSEIAPVWMLYLPVGDLGESVRIAQEEGGTVVKESRGADGELTSVIIQDPLGVYISLAAG